MERITAKQQKPFLFVLLLLLFSPLLSSSNSIDVLQQLNTGTINWTKGTITSSGTHAFDPYSRKRFSQKENAISKAKQTAISSLLKTLLQINIDAATDLRTLIANKPNITTDIQNRILNQSSIATLPHTYNRNRIFIQIKLKLRGMNGFNRILLPFYPHIRLIPEPKGVVKAAFHYTGVVLDLRHFKNFRPSLGTKIFDETGRLIYDPAFTDRRRFVKNGHILFVNSFNSAKLAKRAGNRFIFILPKEIKGKIGSDITLFTKDVNKLLASPITRQNMRRCRVIVICNSFSGR